MATNKFYDTNQLRRFRRVKKRLPRKLALIMLKFFDKSFRNEGYTNQALRRWKDRNKKWNKGQKHKILQKTGHLRRSGKVIHANWKNVEVGYQADYAWVHNQSHHKRRSMSWTNQFGTTTTMPKRQFIGDSRALDRIVTREIDMQIKFIFG